MLLLLLALGAVVGIIIAAAVTQLQHHGSNSSGTAAAAAACNGKKGVVYDYFFQYCSAVTLTNSSWWINFDAGYDYSCTDPDAIVRHQPMIFGSDRITSGYTAINRLPSYAKPSYLLTFNEPNYANGGIEDTNIMDPATAASLWPQLTSRFDPLEILLIAPSPITCSGDPNCRNVGTAAGWISEFREALNNNTATEGAWEAIHALSYHTYATSLQSIINGTTSLYQQFNKPIWITEIASGSDSTMEANIALMEAFIPWADNQPWIERYFWNQATPPEGTDTNIQNSYLVNESITGSGNGSLTELGQVYTSYPC